MKTIDQLGELRGKRVLVRSDLNVPLDGTTITDDGRIRASLPTIQRLRDAGAKVVVAAHLGRPKGQPDPKYTLAPVAARLGELLGDQVAFAADTVGDSARRAVAGLADGQVALLENVRFNAGETSQDDAERGAFADDLAALADAFVSDPASCIFDAGLTKVIGDQAKVIGWYDNEWGYSNRLADLVTLVGSRLP